MRLATGLLAMILATAGCITNDAINQDGPARPTPTLLENATGDGWRSHNGVIEVDEAPGAMVIVHLQVDHAVNLTDFTGHFVGQQVQAPSQGGHFVIKQPSADGERLASLYGFQNGPGAGASLHTGPVSQSWYLRDPSIAIVRALDLFPTSGRGGQGFELAAAPIPMAAGEWWISYGWSTHDTMSANITMRFDVMEDVRVAGATVSGRPCYTFGPEDLKSAAAASGVLVGGLFSAGRMSIDSHDGLIGAWLVTPEMGWAKASATWENGEMRTTPGDLDLTTYSPGGTIQLHLDEFVGAQWEPIGSYCLLPTRSI